MKLDKELSEFNQLLASDLLIFFPSSIEVFQDEYETLLFRGPIPNSDNSTQIGSHVSVDLDEEVKQALKSAEPAKCLEMMEILVSNLSTQIKATYDRNHVGTCSMKFKGTMAILTG
jgi:hypothetical protein